MNSPCLPGRETTCEQRCGSSAASGRRDAGLRGHSPQTCQLRGRRSLACRNRLGRGAGSGGIQGGVGWHEIKSVAEAFPIVETHNLSLPSAALDMTPRSEIVGRIGETFSKIRPEILYLPFGGDVHSDHSVVFEAAVACTKWFRYPSIKSVLCYETLSETDLNIDPASPAFRPNIYVDITAHLERKIEIMRIYARDGTVPLPSQRRSNPRTRPRAWCVERVCRGRGVHAPEGAAMTPLGTPSISASGS